MAIENVLPIDCIPSTVAQQITYSNNAYDF